MGYTGTSRERDRVDRSATPKVPTLGAIEHGEGTSEAADTDRAVAIGCLDNGAIAAEAAVGRKQAGHRRERFGAGATLRVAADLPRSGCNRGVDAATIVRLTAQATQERATRWNTRKLDAQLGVSDTAVLSVCHAYGIKSQWRNTLKVLHDPQIAAKLEDIVSL